MPSRLRTHLHVYVQFRRRVAKTQKSFDCSCLPEMPAMLSSSQRDSTSKQTPRASGLRMLCSGSKLPELDGLLTSTFAFSHEIGTKFDGDGRDSSPLEWSRSFCVLDFLLDRFALAASRRGPARLFINLIARRHRTKDDGVRYACAWRRCQVAALFRLTCWSHGVG